MLRTSGETRAGGCGRMRKTQEVVLPQEKDPATIAGPSQR
jgi:hypothetical protein